MTNGKAVDKGGFSIAEPDGAAARAVVLSVPHGGRDYPAELLANLRVPADKLLRLEDRYADLLVRAAGAAGFATVTAHRARAWLDLNRGPEDLDRTMLVEGQNTKGAGGLAAALTRKLSGQMLSARARGGLGLIPRRLPDCGELWARPLSAEDAQARIADYHEPYHAALADMLARRRAALGAAVLLDVHSMPPLLPEWQEAVPDIVIGDLFGMSAPDRLVAPMMELARAHGFTPALNSPYAGGYVLRRHGRPAKGVLAVQLEVSRALYLDEALREPDAEGVKRVGALVAAMAEMLDRLVRQGTGAWPIAAE